MSERFIEKNKRIQAKVFCFFLGVLTGFSLFYLLSLCVPEKGVLYQDTTSGVTVKTWQGVKERNYAFYIDGYPFVSIGVDNSNGRSGSVGLHDANNRLVGFLRITEGHYSFLRLFSNEDHPFFEMNYDSTQGRWHTAVYSRRNTDHFISEVYSDLNANGQFNAKFMYNTVGDYQGDAVYFSHSWHGADVNMDEMSAQAFLVQDGEKTKIDLVFDFDKGWIPASEAAADVHSDEE